ncbi:class I SAM-dependent methyltransferase [Candidatus Woesearchaeota archaeon]|nr:class I SAM-dependent methyltransferase [Candidatus Woesearchaeota archaeon]
MDLPLRMYQNDSALKKRKAFNLSLTPKVDIHLEAMKRIIDKQNPVLDVGCGNADLLIRLAMSTISGKHGVLVGIDSSPGLIQIGAQEAKRKGMALQLLQGNAEELPFRDGQFGTIIMSHTLHVIDHPRRALAEAYRCLRPHGRLILTLHTLKDRPRTIAFLQDIEMRIAKRSNVDRRHQKINADTIQKFLPPFIIKEVQRFESKYHSSSGMEYLDYVNSLRDYFTPPPTPEEWNAMMSMVSDRVKKDIRQYGFIEEQRCNAVVVAEK